MFIQEMNVFILYLIHWENRPAGGAGARNEVGQAGGTKLAEALGACGGVRAGGQVRGNDS